MSNKRIILLSLVCLSITVFTCQTLSWARATNRTTIPLAPPAKSLQGLTDEERAMAIEKWHTERKQKIRRISEERIRLMAREAWKRLLRVNEQQWKILEPKIYKARGLLWTTRAEAHGWGGIEDFHWLRHSENIDPLRADAPDEMIEGKKIADELASLLEDENSKEEEIRKKLDKMLQVREQAKKEFPKAKQELCEVLMTPRQEAIFLIMGYID